MGFLAAYRASLKPLSVEEPIDVAWHRLLGFGVARAALKTPISADALTVLAIVIGVSCGVALAVPFAHHMVVAAGLCTLSAVFDCADGQLARMRKKSSDFGRMLDGVSDSVVMFATAVGAMLHLSWSGVHPWQWALGVATAISCTFHFGHYDHYKNVFLRLTEPTFKEGEDLEHALRRRRAQIARNPPGLVLRFAWGVYLFYVGTQARFIHWTDPYTSARLSLFPPHDAARAAIYRKHALAPMRVWRSLFGLGTHVFTFSLCAAFDRLDLYAAFRLGALNLIAYCALIWWQRAASRAAFTEMQLRLPDQRAPVSAATEVTP